MQLYHIDWENERYIHSCSFLLLFYYFFLFFNVLYLFHLYYILSHICDEFNFYIYIIYFNYEWLLSILIQNKMRPSLLYTGDIVPTIFMQMFKRWVNQQSFYSLTSPAHRRKLVLTSRTKSNLHVMMMSVYPQYYSHYNACQ